MEENAINDRGRVDKVNRPGGWFLVFMSLLFFVFAVVILVGSITYDLGHGSDAPLETKAVHYVEVAFFLCMGIFFLRAGKRILAGRYPR